MGVPRAVAGIEACILAGMVLAVGLMCSVTTAATAASDELYRAQTTVSGQGEANRLIGFAACLEDVLIKLSGVQKLSGDRRLTPYKSNAARLVRAFDYHDQLSGKPHRDEQGTRDRPYDLTVDFDAGKINGVLGKLHLKPWLSHRPVLAVFIEMRQGPKRYAITADGEPSALQRQSLSAAATRRGMPVVLPSTAALASSNINSSQFVTAKPSGLASITADAGGEVVLIGSLVWVDSELGWATQWRMPWQGWMHRWQLRGVTFDEAFRRGLGGAAQILSGHGEPR